MPMSYSEKQEAIIQSTGNNRVLCKGWTGRPDYNGANTSPNGASGQWKGATLVMGGLLKWQPEQASWWHEFGAVKNMGALQAVWNWKYFQTTQSWFVFMEQTGNSNNNLEMRANIRNMTYWVLRRGQTTWEQWQNTSDIYWGNYFAYSMQSAVGRNPRYWREGSHSVITIEGQLRSVSHFGPAVLTVRSPETIEAVMVSAEVRMDPSMPAGTKLAVHIGGDHKWIGDGAFMSYYPGMGVSQLQDVGREWKRIYYVSVEGAQNDMPARRITHARFLSSVVPLNDMGGGNSYTPPPPAPAPTPSPSPSPTPSPAPNPSGPIVATDSYQGIPRPTTFAGLPAHNNFFWIKKKPGQEPDSNAWYVEFKAMDGGSVMANWDTEQDSRLMSNRNNWDPVNWKWPAYVDTSGGDLPRDLRNVKVQWITVDRANMNSVSPHNTIGIGEDYITYWGEDGRNIVPRAQIKESTGAAAPAPVPAPSPSPTPVPTPPAPAVPTGPKIVPYNNSGYSTTSAEYRRLWGPAANGHVTNLSNTTIGPNKMTSFRFRASRGGAISTLQLYWQGGSGYAAGNGGNIRVTICNDDGSNNHFPNLGSVVAEFWFKPGKNTGSIFDPMQPTNGGSLVAGRLYHIVCENRDGNPTANYFSNNSRACYNSTGARPNRMAALTDCETIYNPVGAGWRSLTVGYSNFSRQPIYGIRFTDGGEIGETQMEAASQIGRTAFEWTTSRYGREMFRPQPRAMSFSGLSVAASTTGGTLTVTVGTTQNNNVYSYDLTLGNNRKTEGANISVSPWYDIEFPSTITIPANTAFWVQLKPKSGTWYISAARRGQDIGMAGAWSQSYFQQFVNGGWTGYNKWNAGGNWVAGGESTDSLPVYFTLATATTPTPAPTPPGGGGGGSPTPAPAPDNSNVIESVTVSNVTKNLVRFEIKKKYGPGMDVRLLNIERYGKYGTGSSWWPKPDADGLHKSEWVSTFSPYLLRADSSGQTIMYTFDLGKINMRNVFVFSNGQRFTVTPNNESLFEEEKPDGQYKVEFYSVREEETGPDERTTYVAYRLADYGGTIVPKITSLTLQNGKGVVTSVLAAPITWHSGSLRTGAVTNIQFKSKLSEAIDSRVTATFDNNQVIVANLVSEAKKVNQGEDHKNQETDSIYEGTLGQQADGLAAIVTRKPVGTNQWADWISFVELKGGKIVKWPESVNIPTWTGLRTMPAVIIDHNGRMQDNWEQLSVATLALSYDALFAESDAISGVKWFARGSGYRLSTTELSKINGRVPTIVENPPNLPGSVGEAVPSGVSTFVWVRYLDETQGKIRFQYVPYLDGAPYMGNLTQAYYDSISFNGKKGFPAVVWPGNRLPAGDIARNMRRAYITLDEKFHNNIQMQETTSSTDFNLTNWAKSETLDARGNRYAISDNQIKEWYLGTGDAGMVPGPAPAPVPNQGEIDWNGVRVTYAPVLGGSYRFRVSVNTPLYGKAIVLESVEVPGYNIEKYLPYHGDVIDDGSTITLTMRETLTNEDAAVIITLKYLGNGDKLKSFTIPLEIQSTAEVLPIPEMDFVERWEWSTGIIRTFAGERRIEKRLFPRVWCKYTFKADTQEYLTRLYGTLLRQQHHWGRVFATVIASRTESVTDINTTSNIVYGSRLYSGDYSSGDQLAIMAADGRSASAHAQSVGIGNLVLKSKAPFNARNGHVAPMVNVQAVKGIELNIGKGVNDNSVSAEVLLLKNPYIEDVMNRFVRHNGIYIMHLPIIDQYSIQSTKDAIEIDNDSMKPVWINNTRHMRHRVTIKLQANNIEQVELIKAFVAAHKGKYLPFWLPTYEILEIPSDMTEVSDSNFVLKGDLTERIGPTGVIAIRYKKSRCSSTRALFASSVKSLNHTLQGGSKTKIALEEGFFGGNSVKASSIEFVTILRKTRFDTDTVEFEYNGRDKMTVSLSTITIP